MSGEKVSMVLVHGAWADGTSWARVIGSLTARGIRVIAAPLALTTFAGCGGGRAHAGASLRAGGACHSRMCWSRDCGYAK
jgi:hypothetical protein